MEADFSGYATKAGLKCSDGRTIMPEAFKAMDGKTVPLVWQHAHNAPENVLGHAVLEAREDGVYAYGYFNDTEPAKNARALVQHKDITSLSIYANQLVERTKQVFHGIIREVSLVLSGANPGALIDQVSIQHADGSTDTLDDEAIIYTGLELELEHAEEPGEGTPAEEAADADDPNDTVQEIYDSLSDVQKDVVHYMIGAALEAAGVEHSDEGNDEGDLSHNQEGTGGMSRVNVFENQSKENEGGGSEGHVLTHDAIKGIVEDAQKRGSLREAVESYALQHGIDNIDTLFPQAKNIDDTPEFLSRRMEWVAGVINGTRKSPFSRIRTRSADITMDEARAKGYIKGNMKKEEFFSVSARVTTPTTVYKKQKLDRDDILDITDFDAVVWIKAEMRIMLEEEIARAILIGDGRAVDDEDKIKDPVGSNEGAGIRSILHDHELYVTHVDVAVDTTTSAGWNSVVENVLRARRFYRGSGTPTFYTTNPTATEMLLAKDGFGRRLYNSKAELVSALNVADIVEVQVMEGEDDLLGIIVNLSDYAVGTDRGGEVNMFDFFDIDYNQYKYLIETRCSGALIKLKSALVVHRQAGTDVQLPEPTPPVFDGTSVTIPTDPNVDYSVDGTPVADGTVVPIVEGDTVTVTAAPTAGHYFTEDFDAQWTFTNRA